MCPTSEEFSERKISADRNFWYLKLVVNETFQRRILLKTKYLGMRFQCRYTDYFLIHGSELKEFIEFAIE